MGPDGWAYHKRDHPEPPCLIANSFLLVIVLVLVSPLILVSMIILVPLSCYTRSWQKRLVEQRIAKDNSQVIQTPQGPVEYKKFGPAPYIFYVPG